MWRNLMPTTNPQPYPGPDTPQWPFVKAKWYKEIPGVYRKVRLVVMHDMEYPEKMTAAEDVARYFQNPRNDKGEPVKASAHICVDADSTVQCVKDRNVAFAAPGANSDGIQVEMAGYGRQTRVEWLDVYSTQLLLRSADAVALYLRKFYLPTELLTASQVRAGSKGITGHVMVSQAYGESNHTDPGPNFPWDIFMNFVDNARCKL